MESLEREEGDGEAIVRFRAAGTELAVRAANVDEIVSLESPTLLPGVPRHVAGLVAVRGEALPLLDLAALLGLESPGREGASFEDRDPRVLVVRGGPYRVGLICELVSSVTGIERARLTSPETVQPPELRRFAEARVDLGEGMAILLDVARMLEAARA